MFDADKSSGAPSLKNCIVVFIQQTIGQHPDDIMVDFPVGDPEHVEVGWKKGDVQSPTIGLDLKGTVDNINDTWADQSKGSFVGMTYTCCGLSDQELEVLKTRYAEFKTNPGKWTPRNNCATSGSKVVSGLGLPNISPVSDPKGEKGLVPVLNEFVTQLDNNKFCQRKFTRGFSRKSQYWTPKPKK